MFSWGMSGCLVNHRGGMRNIRIHHTTIVVAGERCLDKRRIGASGDGGGQTLAFSGTRW